MNKRTKRILAAAIIVIAFLALLTIAAVRKPSLGPDIPLVNDVDPFSYTNDEPPFGEPEMIERVYVIQMPFEHAVHEVKKELKSPAWSAQVTSVEAVFESHNDEFVDIQRGRRVAGIVKPPRHWMTDTVTTLFLNPNPDPRGWVTVTTRRHMNRFTLAVATLRKLVHYRLKHGPTEYTDLEPVLFGRATETNQCFVRWYPEQVLNGTTEMPIGVNP